MRPWLEGLQDNQIRDSKHPTRNTSFADLVSYSVEVGIVDGEVGAYLSKVRQGRDETQEGGHGFATEVGGGRDHNEWFAEQGQFPDGPKVIHDSFEGFMHIGLVECSGRPPGSSRGLQEQLQLSIHILRERRRQGACGW
eukprot:scaffold461_cov321-Pavlova_lutheri.AAC.34